MSEDTTITPSMATVDMSVDEEDPTNVSVKIHEESNQNVYRLKPGSKLVIRAKDGTPIATVEVDEE